MPHYTLYYTGNRGYGEVVRITMAAAGIEWDNKVLSSEEWEKLKPDTPFGTAPVLEVDGKKISQTAAIVRYLGREHGMAGRDSLEQAFVDSIICALLDLLEHAAAVYREKDETKNKELYKKFSTETLPTVFGKLSNHVKSNDTFTGDSITIAETYFYTVIELMETTTVPTWSGGPGTLIPFPKLQAVFKKVADQPGVAEWVKKRPAP